MSRATLRFRIGSIPVEVSPGFWIIVAMLGMSTSARTILIWVAVVFASVLVHELGHAMAVLLFGGHPKITLHGMGGLTTSSLPEGTTHLRLKSAIITLAGPGAGFVFGGLAVVALFLAAVQSSNQLLLSVLRMLIWINIGWGAVNLLPVLPMDGGNLVRAALSGSSPLTGYKRALWVSVVLSPVLAGVALYEGWTWASFLFALFAYQAFQQLRLLAREGADTALDLDTKLRDAVDALEQGRLSDAIRLGAFVLDNAKEPARRVAGAQLCGSAHLQAEHFAQALEALERVPAGDLDPMLYGVVLLKAGRVLDAVPYLRLAYEDGNYAQAGSMYVQALREMGDEEEAARVLETMKLS